jgi:hypothetical protein
VARSVLVSILRGGCGRRTIHGTSLLGEQFRSGYKSCQSRDLAKEFSSSVDAHSVSPSIFDQEQTKVQQIIPHDILAKFMGFSKNYSAIPLCLS